MHVEADVLRRRSNRLTGMYAHPHPDRQSFGPLGGCQRVLRLRRSRNRLDGTFERDEEGITLVVHLVATVAIKGVPQQPPMQLQRPAVPLRPQPLQQPRRSLDVGEQHRHRADRLDGHRPSTIAPLRRLR